jgi:hypothetical protein
MTAAAATKRTAGDSNLTETLSNKVYIPTRTIDYQRPMKWLLHCKPGSKHCAIQDKEAKLSLSIATGN